MTEFLIGAHLDNVDHPDDASFAKLRAMRAEVVGTLWTDGTKHRRPVYDRLEAELGRPDYVIRVGPSGKTTPTSWGVESGRALAEVPSLAFAEGRVRVRCLNEVNLPEEGGWAPEEYAAFLSDCGPVLPDGVELVAAPISLGPTDWREWWRRFVAACGGKIPADRIAVNVYAHLLPEATALFGSFGRPVDVTECNTLGIPPGAIRGAWFKAACRAFAAAGFSSAQVFIAGGQSNGAWDERYVVNDEEAAEIGRREAIHVTQSRPEPVKEPTPMLRFVDLSNYQGIVDMSGWKAAGIDGGIVRVSEDGSSLDQFAPANVAQLRARDLLVALYHLTDDRYATVGKSLDNFQGGIANVGGLQTGDVIVNDAEQGVDGDRSPWHAQWGRGAAQKWGYKALFYSAPWWMVPHRLDIEGVAVEYAGLWEAKFTGDPNTRPDDLPGWVEVMVQYTASGSVPGVQGNVDLNTFFGTREDWLKLGKPGAAVRDPIADALAKLRAATDELEQAIKEAA